MCQQLEKQKKQGVCPLCLRLTRLTFHHLIPQKMHRRTYFKKHFSKAELQAGIAICRDCHKGIHKYYDEMTLAKHFSTLEALKQDNNLAHHFTWVAKQHICPPN
jgi:Na+-translocating ferredoxin:NAD+ oxidoreductase RnfC subunit